MKYKYYYLRQCFSNWSSVNLKFMRWIDTIENTIYNKYQLNLLDIPDENYMYYFENNYSPKDVVNIIQDDIQIFINI